MQLYRAIRYLAGGLIGGGILASMGAQETLEALRNPEPLQITCANFQSTVPEREWIKLTECAFDVGAATYFYNPKSGKVTDLYIPLFPNTEPRIDKTKISLHSTKREWMDLVDQMRAVESKQGDVDAFLDEHHADLKLTGEILGTIEYGMSMSQGEAAKLKDLDQELAGGFAIVRHNKSPSLGGGIAMLAIGLTLAIFGLLFGVRAIRR